MAPRHQRGAEARAELAAAHARPEEPAARLVLLLAADGVGPLAVAAVHHDVVPLDARAEELLDDRVHRRAGLDEDDDLPRPLERGDEVRQRGGPHQPARRVGIVGEELLGDRRRPVVDGDAVAVVGHVEGEVLAHHGEADQPDVSAGSGGNGDGHGPHCTPTFPVGESTLSPLRREKATIRHRDAQRRSTTGESVVLPRSHPATDIVLELGPAPGDTVLTKTSMDTFSLDASRRGAPPARRADVCARRRAHRCLRRELGAARSRARLSGLHGGECLRGLGGGIPRGEPRQPVA